MEKFSKLYRKNIRDAVYSNVTKEVNKDKIFYKSMREYMVLKRLES